MNTYWPDDADGDVLRRLQDQGFDFGRTHVIDFNIDFERWPPALEAVEVLRLRFPNAKILAPDEREAGSLQFQIKEWLTYELVTTVQAQVTELLAEYGGVCDSWGVLH